MFLYYSECIKTGQELTMLAHSLWTSMVVSLHAYASKQEVLPSWRGSSCKQAAIVNLPCLEKNWAVAFCTLYSFLAAPCSHIIQTVAVVQLTNDEHMSQTLPGVQWQWCLYLSELVQLKVSLFTETEPWVINDKISSILSVKKGSNKLQHSPIETELPLKATAGCCSIVISSAKIQKAKHGNINYPVH